MSMALQILHVLVFTGLLTLTRADRVVCGALVWCGQFYLMCQLYVWPAWEEYPDGMYIHLVKLLIDAGVAFLLVWYIAKKLHDAFGKNYIHTVFILSQIVILWMFAGWNVIAAVEFPFLKNYSAVYDVYANVSHGLNVLQLLAGITYGLFITGLAGFLRDTFNRMVPWGMASSQESSYRDGADK